MGTEGVASHIALYFIVDKLCAQIHCPWPTLYQRGTFPVLAPGFIVDVGHVTSKQTNLVAVERHQKKELNQNNDFIAHKA